MTLFFWRFLEVMAFMGVGALVRFIVFWRVRHTKQFDRGDVVQKTILLSAYTTAILASIALALYLIFPVYVSAGVMLLLGMFGWILSMVLEGFLIKYMFQKYDIGIEPLAFAMFSNLVTLMVITYSTNWYDTYISQVLYYWHLVQSFFS